MAPAYYLNKDKAESISPAPKSARKNKELNKSRKNKSFPGLSVFSGRGSRRISFYSLFSVGTCLLFL